WLERRLAEMFPPLAGIGSDYFWHGWVCVSYDKNPHAGTADDPTVHYFLACIGSGVALATHCGKLIARRLGSDAAPFGDLLETPLPRFPFPAFRRVYQRLAYAHFAIPGEGLLYVWGTGNTRTCVRVCEARVPAARLRGLRDPGRVALIGQWQGKSAEWRASWAALWIAIGPA